MVGIPDGETEFRSLVRSDRVRAITLGNPQRWRRIVLLATWNAVGSKWRWRKRWESNPRERKRPLSGFEVRAPHRERDPSISNPIRTPVVSGGLDSF